MKITQHRPNFVESDKPLKIAEFNNIKELKNIDFVKIFSQQLGFVKFSVSSNKLTDEYLVNIEVTYGHEGRKFIEQQHTRTDYLMAEYDEKFWVVGRLENADNIELPKWICPN